MNADSTPERIRKARERCGLTPEEVADRVGLPVAWYYDLEAFSDGVLSTVSLAHLRVLGHVLGLEPAAILGESAPPIRREFSDGAPPRVEAVGPVATVEGPGQVVHHLNAAALLERGMLIISETVSMSDLRYGGGMIQASVPLDDELVARDVHVPCDLLQAGRPTQAHEREGEHEVDGIGLARARRKELVVHEAAGAGRALRVSLEPMSVIFDVLRRQNGWIKIAWHGESGALQGWAPSSDMRLVKYPTASPASYSTGCCAATPLARGAKRRVARLRAGASIHASPAGPRWGVVHVAVDKVEVEDLPGKDWLRVLRNPAVVETGCDPSRSWVRRVDLELAK